MQNKIKLSIICTIVSLAAMSQGKLFVTPYINCFLSAMKEVDSVNKKQDFIKTKNFMRKDFLVGIKLTYVNERFAISLGVEEGARYASGFSYNKEPKSLPNRIVSKETSAEDNGPTAIFIEAQYEFEKYLTVKMPKWLRGNSEKPYLIVSRVAPFIGFERRQMNHTFVNNFIENNTEIGTSLYGNISGSSQFHLNDSKQFSVRSGLDWVFYNGTKRRFILTLMCQFSFRDAGHFRYHFSKPTQGIDFYYQTTTRGNGLSIKAGFPIKLFEINKKKAVH
jgi:hypothetical protein